MSSINLENLTMPESTRCAYLFRYFYELESVKLPKNATTIHSLIFDECFKLKNVDIPDTVTTIGFCAFQDCGIESITLPSSLTTIG